MNDKRRKELAQKMYEYRATQFDVAYNMHLALTLKSEQMQMNFLLEWAMAKDELEEMIDNMNAFEWRDLEDVEWGLV